MFSILENKRLTTKYDFKTSVSSFQIESKCFQYLKISVLRQNTTSKHPFHHFQMFSILENKRLTTKYDFKTSVSSFQIESKCFQYLKISVNDKIRLQNIRFIISNRVQMFSILENKRLTTKYDFKTSVSSFQIESKCFQYLKISV